MPWWQPVGLGLLVLLGGFGIGIAAGGKSTKAAAPAPTVTATVNATVTATPTVVKTISTRSLTVTETYTPPPVNQFSDGTYRVGPDIPAGVYKTDGKGDGSNALGCYYAVLNSLNTTDIANNDNFNGPTSVQVPSGKAFEVSGGCSWSKVG